MFPNSICHFWFTAKNATRQLTIRCVSFPDGTVFKLLWKEEEGVERIEGNHDWSVHVACFTRRLHYDTGTNEQVIIIIMIIIIIIMIVVVVVCKHSTRWLFYAKYRKLQINKN